MFVSQKVVNVLKLKSLRIINMRVSGFLDHRDGKMKLNKYEIKVLPINSNNSQMIKAVCTENMFKYQREEFEVRSKK